MPFPPLFFMDELLRLARENNLMLRAICNYIREHYESRGRDDVEDFMRNVLANIVSNRSLGTNE